MPFHRLHHGCHTHFLLSILRRSIWHDIPATPLAWRVYLATHLVYSHEAFAQYPLLPEASLPMQFLVGLGLGALGLDTVTDFATLITGRDPLTGHALTPQEMFITWLAFSLPFVSAGALRGFADDAVGFLEDTQPLRLRVKYGYSQPAGWGVTDEFGNIYISPHGTRIDRLRALYHEQVHAFLTPKGRFQSFRHVTLGAYKYSHLWRYTEEAIAESRAQILTGGKITTGLVFPIVEQYVTPIRLMAEIGILSAVGYELYSALQEQKP